MLTPRGSVITTEGKPIVTDQSGKERLPDSHAAQKVEVLFNAASAAQTETSLWDGRPEVHTLSGGVRFLLKGWPLLLAMK